MIEFISFKFLFTIGYFSIFLLSFATVSDKSTSNKLTTSNIASTISMFLILIAGAVYKKNYFIDIALVFICISFISAILLLRFFEIK